MNRWHGTDVLVRIKLPFPGQSEYGDSGMYPQIAIPSMQQQRRVTAAVLRSAVLALLVGPGVLSGCRKQSPIVAVIPRTTATLLWEPMHLGATEAAQRSGMHIYWNAPADEGDVEKQLSEFALCVKRHYNGIAFAPDETLAPRSIVIDAVHHGIPVVVVNDDLGPPAGPLLSYVSNDEARGARLAAERVTEVLHGRGSIAVIGINTRNESGISREEEFERVLAQIAPAIQITERHFGDTIVTHQQQIAQGLFDAQKVNVIVAMTAIATRGAYYARLASRMRSTIRIVGFDQDLLIPIQSGEVDSVVVEDTRTIGEVAITNLAAQMHGGNVKPKTLVSPLLLTRETLNAPGISRLWQFTDFAWKEQ